MRWSRIRSGMRVSPQQIAHLVKWIASGAQWPRPAMVLFEDEPNVAAALIEGGGRIDLEVSDAHSGKASLIVSPQRYAAKIDGWNFPIAENPGPGEYRYIRFAWKKRGGGAMMFELANDGQWRTEKQTNAAWSAGRNTTGWDAVFGRGIVAMPNDFGFTGERPTHPELLDWLEVEFVESDWSIKHMHWLIAKSETYRQASRIGKRPSADPNNHLLWRQNPRRLDAESLRDALLFVSGELLPIDSGPPKWPAIPEFIRRSNPATLDDNGRLQNWYTTTPEEDTYVRSVFSFSVCSAAR